MKCFTCGTTSNLKYEKGTNNIFCSHECRIEWPLSILPQKEVRWKILAEFSFNDLNQYFNDHKFDNEERAIFTPDFFRFYVRKNPQYFTRINDIYSLQSDILRFQIMLHAFGELNNDIRNTFCRRIINYEYYGFSKFILNWINNGWINPRDFNLVKYAFRDVPYSGKDAIDLFNNKNSFDPSMFSTNINQLYYEGYEGHQLILFKILIEYGLKNDLLWENTITKFDRLSTVEDMLLRLKRTSSITLAYRILLNLELLRSNDNLGYLKDSKKYGQIIFEPIPTEMLNIETVLYYIKNDGKGIIRSNLKFNDYIYKNIHNFSGLELRDVINAIKPIKFTESIEFYKHIKNLDEAGGHKMFEDIERFIYYCEVKREEYRKAMDNLYFVFDDALQVFQKYNKRKKSSR